MSKVHSATALAALIAAAALTCAPARAQQLPNLFLRPPLQAQPDPQAIEPDAAMPDDASRAVRRAG